MMEITVNGVVLKGEKYAIYNILQELGIKPPREMMMEVYYSNSQHKDILIINMDTLYIKNALIKKLRDETFIINASAFMWDILKHYFRAVTPEVQLLSLTDDGFIEFMKLFLVDMDDEFKHLLEEFRYRTENS